MAMGVPVVATAVGGVPELVAHGETGFLYAPGDVGALTGSLRQLLDDPALRRRMGQTARERAQRTFAPAVVGDATVAAYQELLGLPARVGSLSPIAIQA
jgi:glycosyltransferase involved in cell wall biosynthesis